MYFHHVDILTVYDVWNNLTKTIVHNVEKCLKKKIKTSHSDNLKAESLKAFGDLNKDLKCSRDYKLQMLEAKLESIKQIVFDETAKLTAILKDKD